MRRCWPLLLALLLLTLAVGLPSVELNRASYRYLVVFDITQSMNVEDAGPEAAPLSRMELARQAVDRAVQTLPCGAELGFGLFTGHRTLVLTAPVEVCHHRRELRAMVASFDWTLAWLARSEIAKGLLNAILAAELLGETTRVVFITDGHEAPPVHPDYRQRFRGKPGVIGGLIVGVGGSRPVPIPKLDYSGELIGYWQANEVQQVDSYSLGRTGSSVVEAMVGVDAGDLEARIRQGSEHLSQRMDEYLRELASETGLSYHPLTAVEMLATRLQATDLALRKRQATDLGSVPAALALLLILSIYLPRQRRGRNQASP